MMVQMGKTVIIDPFSEARFILAQQMTKDVLIPGVQTVAQTSSPAGNKETGNEPKDQQMKPPAEKKTEEDMKGKDSSKQKGISSRLFRKK